MLHLVLLGNLLTLVESFDKTVDVNGLKLYGENSDQVHFKFQLSKRDNPKASFHFLPRIFCRTSSSADRSIRFLPEILKQI